MNKPAAIYARVSSDRQKESHTIGSQTSALVEYAQTHGYAVPSEWVFQDEGYSGASLVRPGLEALRDLAAQGQIVAALIYSPDRLSRKYAYQVLLSEELSRCGVDVIYLKSPSGDSPEDQLVVQFQGMIAEYERAQIAERHRRGKRHRVELISKSIRKDDRPTTDAVVPPTRSPRDAISSQESRRSRARQVRTVAYP